MDRRVEPGDDGPGIESAEGFRVASVELRGLTKRYGSLAVVDTVSLKIEHGLLVCLLGPSGCGKTTTLRLIAGFVEPTAGEIVVGDRVVSSPARTLPPEARKMSMIFQSYALWPHMTVADNVAYGLTLRKMPRAEIARKVAAILATTRLIAVMNLGRIEQLGSPEDIYDRPRSEFVARFIGAANILKGRALDRDHVAVAGAPLRCVGAVLVAGSDAAISIRQHEVQLATAPAAGASDNMLPGTVTRNVFLGNSRDYMVELADGTQIRAVTAPHADVPQGAKVWLHLPPERCRALVG